MDTRRIPTRMDVRWLITACAVVLAGCAHGPSVTGPQTAASQPVPSPFNLAEKAFVLKASSNTLYQLEVSRLAATRATDQRVRAYAEGMVQRQTRFTGDLAALMSAKGVTVPQGLPPDQEAKLRQLKSVPPSAAFDHGYVRVVGIEDHQANIALLEQGRRIAVDKDLRAWIDRNLPVLRRQLGVAQALANSLPG